MNVTDLADDLAVEQAVLDDIVSPLGGDALTAPTASPGWRVVDQIGHLAYFDRTAALAITDPDAFEADKAELFAGVGGEGRSILADLAPSRVVETWRANRDVLAAATATLSDGDRVPWYGPSMGAKSFLTARLMECWAHGQDVADAVGVRRAPTDRLRHVAQIGFITRGWTYVNRGEDMPDVDIGVVLDAPSGGEWSWGPDDAPETITGPAEDFCLVVTQRRHVDDTDLAIHGDAARDWMHKAQAFAGAATDGPQRHR